MILTTTMLAVALSAGTVCEWRQAPLSHPHANLVELVQTMTARSILGDELEPLVDAFPHHLIDTDGERRQIEAQVESGRVELRRRLGLVADWKVAEVLTDESGRVKVRVRFYTEGPGAGGKRPFRGVSFIFRPVHEQLSLVWIGYWDPETGSWDVLNDSG